MQPSIHIVKPRGGPATLIPTPNESEAPIESYASLSEGPTIEAPATPTLFIGFDPENEDDHALLDRHLRRSATHGDFIEVWSSVLNGTIRIKFSYMKSKSRVVTDFPWINTSV